MHRIVEISDQGLGIPEADRERVFERFVRLDPSRNRIEQSQIQQNQTLIQQNQIEQGQLEQGQSEQSGIQQKRMGQSSMQQSLVQQGEIQPIPNQYEASEKPPQDRALRNPSTAIKPGGAGLGLAIARSIVQAHGGTLSFHSGPNGIGTTARVCLPIGSPKLPVAAKTMVIEPNG